MKTEDGQGSAVSFVPRPTDWGNMEVKEDSDGCVQLVGEDGRILELKSINDVKAEVAYSAPGMTTFVAHGNPRSMTFRARVANGIAGPQYDVANGIGADLNQAVDVLRIQEAAAGPARPSDDLSAADLARAVFDSYVRRGTFYRSRDGGRAFWLHRPSRQLYELRVQGPEDGFRHRLFESHNLVPSQTKTRDVISGLRSLTVAKAEHVDVFEIATLRDDAFYVYANNGSMWRVEAGETHPTAVPNGENGILFLHHEGLPALKPAHEVRPGAIEELLGQLVRVEPQPGFTAEAQLYLLKNWIINALITPPGRTRPIVAFVGEAGSGKTKGAASPILQLIYGTERGLCGLGESQRDIETTLVKSPFACFDNLDGPVSAWVQNLLAGAASGREVSRRELYTDEGLYHRTPCCNLLLTSRDPQFCREDVAQRILPFYLRRFPRGGARVSEEEITAMVEHARPACWAEIFHLAGQVLEVRKRITPIRTDLRLADFARVVDAVAHVDGRQDGVPGIIDALQGQQARFASRSDPLVRAIRAYYAGGGTPLQDLLAGELLQELQPVEPELDDWSPRRLASRLRESIPLLEWLGITIKQTRDKHQKAYRFSVLPIAGQVQNDSRDADVADVPEEQ
jgi:hypothetical protein